MTDELSGVRGFCLTMLGVLAELGELSDDQRTELDATLRTARSARVLRQVAGDFLEWTQDLGGEALVRVDAMLATQGLPTLSLMRSSRDRRIVEVLDRGRIRGDEEYRLLHERLADVGPTGLPKELRERADAMMGAYDRGRTA